MISKQISYVLRGIKRAISRKLVKISDYRVSSFLKTVPGCRVSRHVVLQYGTCVQMLQWWEIHKLWICFKCIPCNKHENNSKKVRLWIRNGTEIQVTVLYGAMRISCDRIHVTLPNNIQLKFKIGTDIILLTEHSGIVVFGWLKEFLPCCCGL